MLYNSLYNSSGHLIVGLFLRDELLYNLFTKKCNKSYQVNTC